MVLFCVEEEKMLELISIIILAVLVIYSLIRQYRMEKKNEEEKENKIDTFCNKHYKKIWVVFAIILFITVIYQFGNIPTYIGVDEAGMAYDAYCLAEYGTDRYGNSYPLYLTNFGSGQSALCAYLVALCIKLFGANMLAYRLPTLLIYLMSVIVSYLYISKAKNKKTALLFTFLIITCPWNIENARMALDCNLYAGLFMLDLYLLDKAKKNYQYVLAGIAIGLTLYTYILSWITLPLFLLVWIIYMLYIKKITFKQIVILGIPIFIFALPLIYFLLLNFGIVEQTQIGIFTLPILSDFRANQISLANYFNTGLESLNRIFLANGTIYLVYVPLFVIGYVLEIKKTIREIRNKEYGASTVMVIAFTTLLLGLLTTRIPTPNKANVLYIPILYFVTMAILAIARNSKAILISFLVLVTILCVDYECYYYTYRGTEGANYYEDRDLMRITEELEAREQTKELPKHVLTFKSGAAIYTMLGLKLSPQEFGDMVEYKDYTTIDGATLRKESKVAEYHFIYLESEVMQVNQEENNVFVISNRFPKAVQYLKDLEYECREYGDYFILMKNIEW